MHGIPEEISSDGGSTYMAYVTQKFLSDYGVRHRVSSVAFPHSNQRAELAVKSMKRLCRENTNQDGSLDNDKFLRAVMTYRNTPDRDTKRSPAQVIFGRNLKDFLPAPLKRYQPQPQWVLLREDRENALRKRALRNTESLKIGTKQLEKLEVHDTVQIQNQVGNHPSRWDITGTVVEVRPFDQYIVKVHGSGRLTARNRKFLRKIVPYAAEDKKPVFDYVAPKSVPELSQDEKVLPSPEPEPRQADSPAVLDDPSPVPVPTEPRMDTSPRPVQPGPMGDMPMSAPAPAPAPASVGQRHSSRSRREPDKLQLSWKGQSYVKDPSVQSLPADCITASHSIG